MGDNKSFNKDKAYFLLFLLCFFFIFVPILILVAWHYDQTGPGTIIYDKQQDIVVAELGFYHWLIDRGKYGADKRYFSASGERALVGTTANVAYKVKISLDRADTDAVKRYFSHEEKSGNSRKALFKEIESCVQGAIKIQYQIQGYPEMMIRSFSLGNMEHYCPLSAEFGYQWASDLEIMQCYQKPNKEMEKHNCWERLSNSSY